MIERVKKESGLEEFSYRSPFFLALSSAFVPGLGQAMQGNWGSAGTAFFLSAFILGTTIEFVHRGQVFAAGTSAMLFSMVYLASIVNASSQAKTYNQTKFKSLENLSNGICLQSSDLSFEGF